MIQTQFHFSNLFQQTVLSPLARYIEKVSVDCGFWGPCCGIYKSSLFSCRSKHIHAIINQSRIGEGLRLVPLARLSDTGSRQWWSDCQLVWSQNSVAPQYCKMNPALSLLKTAREMKAVDRLPIPRSSTLMTDAPVRDIHPKWAQVPGGPLHLSVKVRWWVLKYVLICLYVWWSWRWGDMCRFSVHACSWSSWTSWYLALQAAVERNIEKKKSVSVVNCKEWKTNAKIHTGIWRCII